MEKKRVGWLASQPKRLFSTKLFLKFKNTGNSVWDLRLDGDIKYEADRPFFHSFIGEVTGPEQLEEVVAKERLFDNFFPF